MGGEGEYEGGGQFETYYIKKVYQKWRD